MAANNAGQGVSFPFFSMSNNQNNLGIFGSSSSSEKPLPPPPPSVEVVVSEEEMSSSTVDSLDLDQGLTLLKGRVSTREVFALSNSDLVPGKYEGGLKLWEGSLDLVKTMRSQIQDKHLSLTGKKVIELGCGHGLPGIFACLEGAAVVHFQDFNAEVLQCLTVPNVDANIKKVSHKPFSVEVTKRNVQAEVRFFAGDWSEVHHILPFACDSEYSKSPNSRSDHYAGGGYDVILMAETVYSISSLQNLYDLTKKCLSHPHGVMYLAAKKHYFGVGGGTRQFLSTIEKDGVMVASLIAELADGSSNVRERSIQFLELIDEMRRPIKREAYERTLWCSRQPLAKFLQYFWQSN